MGYIVVGPVIIDEMETGPRHTRLVPGGVLYALAGARTWTSDCLLVTNAGSDFGEVCGRWMSDNHLSTRGVRIALERTKRSRLRYVDGGLFDEEPVFDLAQHERIQRQDRRTADQLLQAVDTATRGVYVEAADDDPLWHDGRVIALARRIPLMWEVQTRSALEPARRDRTRAVARDVGLFSVNLPEACALFGVSTEDAAVEAALAFGVPCYLRVGAHGSYLLAGGEAHHEPGLTLSEVVDPTGCGNASTAAALVGLGDGVAAADVPRMGNIAAAFVLQQFGPPPVLGAATDVSARSALTRLRAAGSDRRRGLRT